MKQKNCITLLMIMAVATLCNCGDGKEANSNEVVARNAELTSQHRQQRREARDAEIMTIVAYKNEIVPDVARKILKSYHDRTSPSLGEPLDLLIAKLNKFKDNNDNSTTITHEAKDVVVNDLAQEYKVSKKVIVQMIIDYKILNSKVCNNE